MNSNGVLSFDATFANCCPPRDFPLVSPPLIAPFWHDVDLTSSGSEGVIYYRQTNDSIYLQLVHILLMNVDDIGDLVNFFPKQIFIATWDLVPQFGRSTSVRIVTVVDNECRSIVVESEKRGNFTQDVLFCHNFFNLSPFQGHKSSIRLLTWFIDTLGLLLHRSNVRSYSKPPVLINPECVRSEIKI